MRRSASSAPGRPTPTWFCTPATRAIVEAMARLGVRRLVCQTGAMIGERWPTLSFPFRLMAASFRRQRPEVAADRVAQERAVMESATDWLLVKPPRLTDGGRSRRLRVGPALRIGLLSSVARVDLAALMLDEVATPTRVREVVYVAG